MRLRNHALAVALAGAVVLLAACDHIPTPSSAFSQTAAALPAGAAEQVQLIQEPADDYHAIYRAISAAHTSLTMTMYEMADSTAQADLISARRRGVAVEVLLDRAFHGRQINQAAYAQLHAAGVQVHWAPANQIFHQKTLTVDGTLALIGTGNLTSRYYSTSRDAWISDTNPTQVKAITATFAADWTDPTHSGNAVGAPGLVWSPGAGQSLTALISSARTSVDFSSEELSDRDVIAALAGDARRGVTCRIVMTDSAEWHAGFAALTAAGCRVHDYPDSTKALYIHEKQIIVDDATILLGSQNASATSLNKNRELSIQVTAPTVVTAAVATFDADFGTAPEWKAVS